MSNIRRFAAGGIEPDLAKQTEIEALLAELRKISQNDLGKLIPYVEKVDARSMSEADEKSPIALADRRAKIGVAFGVYPYSQERKHFGSKYRSKKAVLCKIYRYSHDKLGLLAPIQRAWVAALAEHYKQVLTQSGDSEDVPARIHHILQKLQGYDDRLAAGARIKGAEFTVLIPPDARHKIIKDYVEALIEGGKGVTSSPKGEEALKQLAIFVVPEDPFPYLWQKPEEAKAQGKSVSDPSVGAQLDDSRYLEFDWSSEEHLSKFLQHPIEGETALKPSIQTDPTSGKAIRQHENVAVYDAETNPDYAAAKHANKSLLAKLQQRRLVHFTKDRISTSFIEKFAAPSDRNINSVFAHIQQPDVLGPLVVEDNGRKMFDGYKGIVVADFLFSVQNFKVRTKLDEFEKAYTAGIKARQAYKAAAASGDEATMAQLQTQVANAEQQVQNLASFFAVGSSVGEVAKMLWQSIQSYRRYQLEQEELRETFQADIPRSTFDNALWDKGLIPSLEQNPVAFTKNKDQSVALRFKAEQNPFYLPKVFIDELREVRLSNRASKIEWPAAGRDMPPGFDSNWKSMTPAERSAKIKEMEEKMTKLPQGSLRGKYTESLARVKSCQFLDDLAKYVKETLAFNFKDASNSKVADVIEPPPLFYKTDFDGNQKAVTMKDLLLRSKDEEETDEILSHNPLKEDPHFGFAYDIHPDVRAMIEGQVRAAEQEEAETQKEASIVNRLLHAKAVLAQLAGEPDTEVFFDLEGEQYPSLDALAQELGKDEQSVDPKQVKKVADQLIDVANSELVGFKREVDDLINRIQAKIDLAKQKPVAPPVQPSPVNKPIQMPPRNMQESVPVLDEEPLAVAAKTVRKFTK